MPNGGIREWCMGTFYAVSPSVPLKSPKIRRLEAPDALVNLEQSKLTDWLTIPSTPRAGSHAEGDPIGWIKAFITDLYPLAGVSIPDTTIRIPATAAKVYQPGTSMLELFNDLLKFCNYEVLHANITGSYVSYPFVLPSERAVEYVYTADERSIVIRESGVIEEDLFYAPNQWVRTVSRPDKPVLRTRLTLDDPTNPLSTVSRGRTVTDYAAIDAPDQTTLDRYVMRIAEEGQRVGKRLRVDTPLMPHDHSDVLAVNWPLNPTWNTTSDGIYVQRGWTFPCVAGGKMTHDMEIKPQTPAQLMTWT